MKWFVCLALLVVCAEALPRRVARNANEDVQKQMEHERKLKHDAHERKLHGHSRRRRQADPCASFPCINGASCFSTRPGNFYCQCAAGFSGAFCEISLSDSMSATAVPPRGRQCGNTITVSPAEDRKQIRHRYSNMENCTWIVNVAMGFENTHAVVAVIEGTNIEREGSCIYDALSLDDTDGSPLVTMCGRCEDGTYLSSGPAMIIGFRSDTSVVGHNNFNNEHHIVINLLAVPKQVNQTILNDIQQSQQDMKNQAQCTVVDPRATVYTGICSSNPCQNGASCFQDPNGSQHCFCSHRYTGIHCEIMLEDPCANVSCPNGGSCYSYGPGHAECSGAQDMCYFYDCGEGSCFMNGTGMPACACMDGTVGTYCNSDGNSDVCRSQPCLNGGSCVDYGYGYPYCDCHHPYAGHFCEIRMEDPCANVTCPNGGLCYSHGPGHADCYGSHYSTASPQQVVCSSQPCLNGGSCVDYGYGNAYCACYHPYTGTFCETRIEDPCANVICPDGGSCYSYGPGHAECYGSYYPTGSPSVPRVPCGVNSTQEVTPGNPVFLSHQYYDNQDCLWSFKTSENQLDLVLEASVTRINVETNYQCTFDWVEMSDPTVAVEPVKVCGTCRQGSFQSGSDELYIIFHSDDSVIGNSASGSGAGGFDITIRAVPRNNATRNEINNFGMCNVVDQDNSSPEPEPWHTSSPSPSSCVPAILNITTSQIIRSRTDPFNMEHPNNYPDLLCQEWELNASGPDQCLVATVSSDGFVTESIYDFVIFQDVGTDAQSRREGNYSTFDILYTSTTNHVQVTFTTDFSVNYRGFSLEVKAIACADRALYPAVAEARPMTTTIGYPDYPSPSPSTTPEPVMNTIYLDEHVGEMYVIRHPEVSSQGGRVRRQAFRWGPQFEPRNYGNDENVQWIVTLRNSQPGKAFRLKVDNGFSTEEYYDFLHVNDSNKEVARIDGAYPANFPLALVAGDVMTLNFRSDGSVTGRGFNVTVTLVDEATSDLCSPNPCHNGAVCQVREDMMTDGVFGGLSMVTEDWFSSPAPAGPVQTSCGPYGAQVCCLCASQRLPRTKDCKTDTNNMPGHF